MTGDDGEGASPDRAEQVTRYEDLRQHVTAHGGGHRLGLALFHREGMRAWLEAWSRCTTRDARVPRDASEGTEAVRLLTLTGDVGAVVHLVASMAMAMLQDGPIVTSGRQPGDLPS